MAQPFSLRHLLIAFHGNWRSPEDPPAADRYTGAGSPLAMQMLADIDEDTVDFADNYWPNSEDGSAGSLPQPASQRRTGHCRRHGHDIPAQPRRGARGCALLRNPGATVDDPMEFGGRLPNGRSDPRSCRDRSVHRTGRGSVKQAKVEIEEKGQTQSIVVTELPYQVSAGAVARKIAELVNSRELEAFATSTMNRPVTTPVS